MFFSTILGHFFSNPVVQAETSSAINQLMEPTQFYRDNCINLLDEVRTLYLRTFTNKPFPEILMYRHERNNTNLPSDGIFRPPFDLNPKYCQSNYTFGENILRELCIVNVAHISKFLTQLNEDADGAVGRIRRSVGNKNDSVRVILNLVIQAFVTLSLVDVKNISDLSDPIVYINFINKLQTCPLVRRKKRITSTKETFHTVLAQASTALMEIQGIIKTCQSEKSIQDHFNTLSLESQHYKSDLFKILSRIISTRSVPEPFSLLSLDLSLTHKRRSIFSRVNDEYTLFDKLILDVGNQLNRSNPHYHSFPAIPAPSDAITQLGIETPPALNYGYELCLWTSRDMHIERNKLYIEIQEGFIRCTLISIDGKRHTEDLTQDILNREIKASTSLTEMSNSLPRILNILWKKGYTPNIGIIDEFEGDNIIDSINACIRLIEVLLILQRNKAPFDQSMIQLVNSCIAAHAIKMANAMKWHKEIDQFTRTLILEHNISAKEVVLEIHDNSTFKMSDELTTLRTEVVSLRQQLVESQTNEKNALAQRSEYKIQTEIQAEQLKESNNLVKSQADMIETLNKTLQERTTQVQERNAQVQELTTKLQIRNIQIDELHQRLMSQPEQFIRPSEQGMFANTSNPRESSHEQPRAAANQTH